MASEDSFEVSGDEGGDNLGGGEKMKTFKTPNTGGEDKQDKLGTIKKKPNLPANSLSAIGFLRGEGSAESPV